MDIYKKTIGTLALVAIMAAGVAVAAPADAGATFIGSVLSSSKKHKDDDHHASYGNAGKKIEIEGATVLSKTATTFTVKTKKGATLTFKVTSSTRFEKGSFASLAIGDLVKVEGRETDSGLVASKVRVEDKKKDGRDHGRGHDDD